MAVTMIINSKETRSQNTTQHNMGPTCRCSVLIESDPEVLDQQLPVVCPRWFGGGQHLVA